MTRLPMYLTVREVPDKQLLNKIREMVKDGKSPRKIKDELLTVSLCTIRRYYGKIRRGLW